MTGGNEMFWSYAAPNGRVASPCVHRTNWSMSLVSPLLGNSTTLNAIAARTPTMTMAIWPGVHADARGDSGVIGASDPLGDPVALGEPVDPAERSDLPPERPNGVGHLARPAEQPIELALVQSDAGDLALELVGHVGVVRGQRDIA